MKRLLISVLILVSWTGALDGAERESFNGGWKFYRGDDPDAGESLAYERVKSWMLPTGDHLLNYVAPRPAAPRVASGWWLKFPKPDFDDSAWRTLDLPHDWGIEGPFAQELPGSTGKLPWAGTGWYRKKFMLPTAEVGQRVYLEFDGVMSYALVWCNGQIAGGWAYGYSSWRVDLTALLKPGAENVIAVRVSPPRESSRWYPGAGIYRNVWLTKTAEVAVGHWGVNVTTPQVSPAEAWVNVGVTLENQGAEPAEALVSARIFAASADGKAVGDALVTAEPQTVKIRAGGQAHAAHTLFVKTPRLWSLRERHRYVAETRVERAGRVVDIVHTPFGIRTLASSATDGFRLNGERIAIRGVCLHHDLGALGAAINTRAIERQLEILQSFGCNAIRTSHNPPAPELLELADRMGFLVQVELADAWRSGKKPDDYSRLFDDWHERDLRAMLRRDRNHPSVIQWSIGNELPELGDAEGWKLAAHLAGIVREEDRSRAVVVGSDKPPSAYNGFETVVDVLGFNYKPTEYAKLHARHPHVAMMGSETASTISSRGEYFFPVSDKKSDGAANFHVSSYDLYAPWWAWPPDVEWKALDENPYVLGEFVWTGFDYLGEPTPFDSDATNLLNFADPAAREKAAKELAALGKIRVPARSSYFGIVDLAGFPKDRYYLYQARWRPELPMAHILPHWNWPERVGQVTPVHVYTSGDEAELFLNGVSLGRKSRGPFEYRFRWDEVKYAPGELRVVAYKNAKPWAEAVQRTTGEASALRLSVDRAELRADGTDLAYVKVEVVDRDGLVVPRTKPLVQFSVSGPAEIVATDNGDPTDHRVFARPERNAFNGLALAIVRPKRGASGEIIVTAASDGLAAAKVKLQTRGNE